MDSAKKKAFTWPSWRGSRSERSLWAIALHLASASAFFRYLNAEGIRREAPKPRVEDLDPRLQPKGSAAGCCLGRRITPCEFCTGERCRWCGMTTCLPNCDPPAHVGRIRKRRSLPNTQRVLLSEIRRHELSSDHGWAETGDLNQCERLSALSRSMTYRSLDALLLRGLAETAPASGLYVRTTAAGRDELGDETGASLGDDSDG